MVLNESFNPALEVTKRLTDTSDGWPGLSHELMGKIPQVFVCMYRNPSLKVV
jgi:hypothetical protein